MKLNKKIRTDLLYDLIESGVIDSFTKKIENSDIKVNRTVLDKATAKKYNKKIGSYTTILFNNIDDNASILESLKKTFVKELKHLLKKMKITKNSSILIVGLGNDKSTPDALGPIVAKNIIVTRYLLKLKNIELSKNFRNVSAIIPGVTGVTGIETLDLIKSVVTKTKPNLVIVIDALASSSLSRLNKTIQLTDTGIHPGSGVSNERKEISIQSLKVPVLSIGVPTVIDAVTLVNETINNVFSFFENMKQKKLNANEKDQLLGILGVLSEEERQKLIFDILTNYDSNLIITTKEIDFVIDKLSELIAEGLNEALHS